MFVPRSGAFVRVIFVPRYFLRDGDLFGLVGLSSNGFPSKFELAAVADDDGSPRTVFFVRRNISDPRDDVFVTTDHPAEHHVFAVQVGARPQGDEKLRAVRVRSFVRHTE
jgi:hypothetical protein